MAGLPLKPVKLYLNMEKKSWKQKLARLGVAGFLFFLVKGLLWLAIGAGAIKACQ